MKALLVPWPQAAAVRGARCACTEHSVCPGLARRLDSLTLLSLLRL